MKMYKVGVFWNVGGYVYVEAKDEDEAIAKAENVDLDMVEDVEYLEDSFQVDDEFIEEVKGE